MPGSFAIEAVLALLAFLIFLLVNLWVGLLAAIPVLAYSIRRYTTREMRCPVCNSEEIVPLDSPRGRDLLRASKSVAP